MMVITHVVSYHTKMLLFQGSSESLSTVSHPKSQILLLPFNAVSLHRIARIGYTRIFRVSVPARQSGTNFTDTLNKQVRET